MAAASDIAIAPHWVPYVHVQLGAARAAVLSLEYFHETTGVLGFDALLARSLDFVGGEILVPPGHGHGIELDMDADPPLRGGGQPVNWELDGRVALVTGAATGIGAAIAEALEASGVAVHGADVTWQADSPRLAGRFELDVTDRERVREAVDAIVAAERAHSTSWSTRRARCVRVRTCSSTTTRTGIASSASTGAARSRACRRRRA